MGMFPVYLAKKGTKLPNDKTFFILAANGPHVHRVSPNGLFKGLYRCGYDDIPDLIEVSHCLQTEQGPVFFKKEKPAPKKTGIGFGWSWKDDEDDVENLDIVDLSTGKEAEEGLLYVEPYITMNLPKLEPQELYLTLLWMREIYRLHHAEAILILGYNVETGKYKLFCPKQDVSGAHINYNRQFREYIPAPWRPVGTIHSHPGFNAYHSGTDTHDEQSFDGVHLTFGHVSERSFSIASSLIMGAGGEHDYRESVEPENVCRGLKKIGDRQALKSRWISSSMQNFYQIDLPPEEKKALRQQFAGFKDEWLKLVEHRTYTWSNQNWAGGGGMGSTAYDYDDDDDSSDDLTGGSSTDVWDRDADAANRDVPDEEWAQGVSEGKDDDDELEMID